jgi:hypothetical protein
LPGQSQQQATAEKDPDPCPAAARGGLHTSHGGDSAWRAGNFQL